MYGCETRRTVYVVFYRDEVKLITYSELEALKIFKEISSKGIVGLEIKEYEMNTEY